ncbi:MAG TPA: hypothetical protein VH482_23680 [Thermomicrobiales bacterium]|jgi:hypothetical protein
MVLFGREKTEAEKGIDSAIADLHGQLKFAQMSRAPLAVQNSVMDRLLEACSTKVMFYGNESLRQDYNGALERAQSFASGASDAQAYENAFFAHMAKELQGDLGKKLR